MQSNQQNNNKKKRNVVRQIKMFAVDNDSASYDIRNKNIDTAFHARGPFQIEKNEENHHLNFTHVHILNYMHI